MKLIITKENLIKALKKIIGAVDNKPTIPILNHILFRVNDNQCVVIASDLEVQLSSKIILEKESELKENITIPGKKLYDIGNGLPNDAILEIEKIEEGKLQIKSRKSRFVLSALDAKTFPLMEVSDDECQNFSIKSNELKEVVEKTSFAMAQQDVRYYLNGLFFGLSKSAVFGVATDGHRLAKTEIKAETNIQESTSVIIPRKGISEIIKQIEDENIVMSGVISKNHLKISGNNTEAITKLVDGKFPDYEKVIPTNSDKRIVLDSKEFKEALARVSILSNDRFKGVRLSFSNNELKVSANNPEKEEASDYIKAIYDGEEIEVGFNVNYLLDVLGVIKTKNVQIFLKDSSSSALLMPENDDTSNYVVMPLRL